MQELHHESSWRWETVRCALDWGHQNGMARGASASWMRAGYPGGAKLTLSHSRRAEAPRSLRSGDIAVSKASTSAMAIALTTGFLAKIGTVGCTALATEFA